MLRQENSKKSNLSLPTKIISVLIFTCIGCGFFAIGPSIDRGLCLQRVADRVGIEPSYEAIYSYIYKSVKPGMTRNEALSKLEQIGSISVPFSNRLPGENVIIDQSYINICWYWFNDIRLFIDYTADDQQKVTDIVIVIDDGVVQKPGNQD